MSKKPLLAGDNRTIDLSAQTFDDTLYTARIHRVDTEAQTMRVLIAADPGARPESINIPINNPVTNFGVGLRIMPFSGRSFVKIYDAGGGNYQHSGYVLSNLGDITDNITGSKQDNSASLLNRHLEEGEVQLKGAYGNELYMSIDGSILLRNQFGASMKLDNYLSRLEGNFANMKYEMDQVRIRSGNIIRPSMEDTTQDQYVVFNEQLDITNMDQLSNEVINDITKWQTAKEFSVQVGTIADSSNHYVDFEVENLPLSVSPLVGQLTLADAVVRENGAEHFSSTKRLNLYAKAGFGGVNITEDGSSYILDYQNFSSTKFSTDSERALRLQKSYITIQQTDDTSASYATEIILGHESEAEIAMRDGNVEIQEKSGRKITLNPYGVGLIAPDAAVTMLAKDILLLPDGGSISLGAMTTDGVLKATHASLLFDTHTHAGPVGPPLPAFQWQPLLNIPNSLLVAQNLKVV